MPEEEIQPADVYRLVLERTNHTQEMMNAIIVVGVILCVLVFFQVIAKIVIFSKVLLTNRETVNLLGVVRQHVMLTESQQRTTAQVADRAGKMVESGSAAAGAAAAVLTQLAGGTQLTPPTPEEKPCT
jgi:hypothetical protein